MTKPVRHGGTDENLNKTTFDWPRWSSTAASSSWPIKPHNRNSFLPWSGSGPEINVYILCRPTLASHRGRFYWFIARLITGWTLFFLERSQSTEMVVKKHRHIMWSPWLINRMKILLFMGREAAHFGDLSLGRAWRWIQIGHVCLVGHRWGDSGTMFEEMGTFLWLVL